MTADEAVRRYGGFVANLVLRLTGSRDQTEDLVQEVFLAVTKRIGTLQKQEAIKAWLTSITVNVVRQSWRRRRVLTRLLIASAPSHEDVADGAMSPEERSLVAAVYRALDQLPVDERLAWALRHIEGEKIEQVALLCGCSLSTAKRRIEAAQQRLQKAVG
jgi:RNA polymerase sigma-70 factor (ECF subfamily)